MSDKTPNQEWNAAVAKCAEIARRNGAYATAQAIRKLTRPE